MTQEKLNYKIEPDDKAASVPDEERGQECSCEAVHQVSLDESFPADDFLEPVADREISPFRQILKYLDSRTTDYRVLLKMLSESIPPMSPACRASVCIPVAAHEEHGFITQTLKAFSGQSVPNESWEILLFANWPEGAEDKASQVIREVDAFKRENPELVVHLAAAPLPAENAKIGFIRKLCTDIALQRHVDRYAAPSEDHIIFRADADTTAVHRRYVEHFLGLFEKNPHIDSFTGSLEFDHVELGQDPYLYIGLRLASALQSAERIHGKVIIGGGPNFAVRAGVYCAVGGYDANETLGEDVELSRAIKALRSGAKKFIPIAEAGFESRLFTSSRRAFKALDAGRSTIEQWNNKKTSFASSNPDIRKEGAFRPEGYFLSELGSEHFKDKAEWIINRTIKFFHLYRKLRSWEVSDAVDQYLKPAASKMLTELGFKFCWNSSLKIELQDLSEATERLARFYQKREESVSRRLLS